MDIFTEKQNSSQNHGVQLKHCHAKGNPFHLMLVKLHGKITWL